MKSLIIQTLNSLLKWFYPLFRNLIPYEVYAYLSVGAINTALNILLFALFYQWVLPTGTINLGFLHPASYTLSLVLAFVLTVPSGYWLAKQFVFASKAPSSRTPTQLLKYFLVVLQGLVSDYLVMKVLIEYGGVYPTLAKVISTFLILMLNFFLQKYFTFRTKTAGKKV